jgi:hypothetical protein
MSDRVSLRASRHPYLDDLDIIKSKEIKTARAEGDVVPPVKAFLKN